MQHACIKNIAKVCNGETSVEDEADMRDQSFARLRVLLLLPMRNDAYDVIQKIFLLEGGEEGAKGGPVVINRDWLLPEFAFEKCDDGELIGDYGGVEYLASGIRVKEKKPAD